ncbi:MAG: hypothetical protein ABI554_10725 [Flavobacterium sp.]
MAGIEINNFEILEFEVPKEKLGFNINIKFNIRNESNEISCSTIFEYLHADTKLISLESTLYFKIKSEDWEMLKDGNKLIFKKEFLAHLAMNAVGTGRGIFYAKTENTKFRNFPIPLINILKMITEDEEFEVK